MRASSSSSMPAMSGVFAPVIVMAIGTPPPSVRMWRLVPDFARSVGLGPVFSPTERRFVQRSIGRLPRPLQALGRVIVLQEQAPHRFPDALLDPPLEAAVHRRARRKRARHGFPLTPRAEHVEHRVEDAARGNPGTPAR